MSSWWCLWILNQEQDSNIDYHRKVKHLYPIAFWREFPRRVLLNFPIALWFNRQLEIFSIQFLLRKQYFLRCFSFLSLTILLETFIWSSKCFPWFLYQLFPINHLKVCQLYCLILPWFIHLFLNLGIQLKICWNC